MKHPVSRDLYAYWDALRAGRTAPERADVDPAAIRHLLAYTFVLEVESAALSRSREIVFRLSGTRLNALFQRELKGHSFERIWARPNTALIDVVLDGVLDDRSAVVAAARGAPPGESPIDLELLLLPLRHHGRTHARILGSLASAAIPSWMGLIPMAPLDLRCFRTLSGRSPAVDAPRHTPARGAAPERVPARGAVQVGRFKVYQGGRGPEAPLGAGR